MRNKLKIGVIKIGSRISFNANDTSGGNGEARSIIKILELGGHEVHIFTKILKKDDLVSPYVWHNISEDLDTVGLDALMIINGSVNFFGGAEDREQILNYEIINKFQGRVFYAYCDPALILRQLWPAIESKEWAGNYKKSDIEIVRKDIIYLSQPYDIEKVKSRFGKNDVIPGFVIHFPFEKFPCLGEKLDFNRDPRWALSYGGTMRGGKRINKMLKYYFGYPDTISVEMFGKISAEDFQKTKKIKDQSDTMSHPVFSGPVKYADMHKKMNDAMSHIAIGDPLYEELDDVAQRVYESIWSSVVTFVDSDMDRSRRVYGDSELGKFLYVSSKKEAAEKMMVLIMNPEFRQKVVKAQFLCVNFDQDEYCRKLTTILTAK